MRRFLCTSFIRRQHPETLGRDFETMARRFLRRRTLVIAAITVALSVGIVFASIPYLPHPPPRTIQTPVTHDVRGGTTRNPGVYSLTLRGILNTESFAIGVAVTNGMATFCVMSESNFFSWAINNQTQTIPPAGVPFPYDSCLLQEQTAQSTLTFTPTSTGNWDVVAVNTNSQTITVNYTPA